MHRMDVASIRPMDPPAAAARARPVKARAGLLSWQLVANEFARRHGGPMTRSTAETIGRRALAKLLPLMQGMKATDDDARDDQ